MNHGQRRWEADSERGMVKKVWVNHGYKKGSDEGSGW